MKINFIFERCTNIMFDVTTNSEPNEFNEPKVIILQSNL